MMKSLLLIQFDLHHRLYNNVLDGFTDDETNRRLYDDTNINHVKYLGGHLMNSQYGLAEIAGVDFDVRWNELFAGAGQSEAKDNIEYPTIGEIKAEWNGLHDPIRNGLIAIPPNHLNRKPSPPMDQFADSRGELWAFLNHHIAYHIGQIGILRHGFRKAPMSYD
ncbi:MAG TPA: DinB family protein [Fodinibius sp.]|nr:DinB family protein [Fodinibius sp.]